MGKRITLLRARMSYKRRDHAQVANPECCVYLWMVKKTPDKQEQNCFELHAGSWKSSCQWTCHTENSRSPWKDCWNTLFWCFHLHIWHALFNCVKIMPNWEMVIVSVMFLILSKMFFAWHSSSPSSVAGAQWPSTVSCQNNKTQCHLYKRLTGRIIAFVNGHFPVCKAIFGLVTP